MQTIAVTGGSGFLGREVCSLLQSSPIYKPLIIGRQQISETGGIEYRSTDYTRDSLTQALANVDAVVHLASVKGANGTIADYHPNELVMERLLENCAALGIRNIVYASSISVYSDTSEIPWRETHIPTPKTLYGVSKLACEHIGGIYHNLYGLNIKSLRIAHILGEGERKGYMMNTFMDLAFEHKTLKVIGQSIAKREFVYVKDAARAILLALSKPEVHGVFNIGSGEAYSNLEIARFVNERFENTGNLEYVSTVDEGIESSLMDSSKAHRILGYAAGYSFAEALDDIRKIKLEGVAKHV